MIAGIESVLVDSNIFIGYLRARKDPAIELLKRFDATDLVTCGVVKSEVLRGITNLKVRARMEAFFSVMRNIETTHSIWDATWQLAWSLDRQGRVLPLTEIVIAAVAQKAEAAILTDDRHFDAIPDLRVLSFE